MNSIWKGYKTVNTLLEFYGYTHVGITIRGEKQRPSPEEESKSPLFKE